MKVLFYFKAKCLPRALMFVFWENAKNRVEILQLLFDHSKKAKSVVKLQFVLQSSNHHYHALRCAILLTV